MEKRVEKWAKIERQQQRGLKGNEQKRGKPERNTAYFCEQENVPRQQGDPKAVLGAPTQAAVIKPLGDRQGVTIPPAWGHP